jgi:hypothetical protein
MSAVDEDAVTGFPLFTRLPPELRRGILRECLRMYRLDVSLQLHCNRAELESPETTTLAKLHFFDPMAGRQWHWHDRGLKTDRFARCVRLFDIRVEDGAKRGKVRALCSLMLASRAIRSQASALFWQQVRVEVVGSSRHFETLQVGRQDGDVAVASVLDLRIMGGALGTHLSTLSLRFDHEEGVLHCRYAVREGIHRRYHIGPRVEGIEGAKLRRMRADVCALLAGLPQLRHLEVITQTWEWFECLGSVGILSAILAGLLDDKPRLRRVGIKGGRCDAVVRQWHAALAPRGVLVSGLAWDLNPCIPSCNYGLYKTGGFNAETREVSLPALHAPSPSSEHQGEGQEAGV